MSTNNGNAEGGNSTTTNPSTDDNNVRTEFEPITSQEDFDKRIGARLHEERSKYKDYAELKEKAEKYDEVAESQKTEIEKVTERAEKAEKELESIMANQKLSSLRKTIRNEMGIPEDMESLLTATDEDEMKKQAEIIQKNLSKTKRPVAKSDSGNNFNKNDSGGSELSELAKKLTGGN